PDHRAAAREGGGPSATGARDAAGARADPRRGPDGAPAEEAGTSDGRGAPGGESGADAHLDQDQRVTAERLRKLRQHGLTVGTLGSTAGQTVMVALLPILLAEYAPSAVWIGFAIGGEGVFALLVPYWIGALSDHLPQRLAR